MPSAYSSDQDDYSSDDGDYSESDYAEDSVHDVDDDSTHACQQETESATSISIPHPAVSPEKTFSGRENERNLAEESSLGHENKHEVVAGDDLSRLCALGSLTEAQAKVFAIAHGDQRQGKQQPRNVISRERIEDLARPKLPSRSRRYAKDDDMNNCTFRPPRSKAAARAMRSQNAEHQQTFLDRLNAREKHRRRKMRRDKLEADYKNRPRKKYCPNCGLEQSYDEMIQSRTECANDACEGHHYRCRKPFMLQHFEERMRQSDSRRQQVVERIQEERRQALENSLCRKGRVQKELIAKVSRNEKTFLTGMSEDIASKPRERKRNVERSKSPPQQQHNQSSGRGPTCAIIARENDLLAEPKPDACRKQCKESPVEDICPFHDRNMTQNLSQLHIKDAGCKGGAQQKTVERICGFQRAHGADAKEGGEDKLTLMREAQSKESPRRRNTTRIHVKERK